MRVALSPFRAQGSLAARRERGGRTRRRRALYWGFIYAAATAAASVVLAPFVWLLISSVADPRDLLARPLRWIPEHVSFARYSNVDTIVK